MKSLIDAFCTETEKVSGHNVIIILVLLMMCGMAIVKVAG